MKKIAIFLTLLLTGCSYFHVHKIDVEQGNIINDSDVKKLHSGMSESQVTALMGTPLVIDTFTPNQVSYVYTFKPGYGEMTERAVVLTFHNHRLLQIDRSVIPQISHPNNSKRTMAF